MTSILRGVPVVFWAVGACLATAQLTVVDRQVPEIVVDKGGNGSASLILINSTSAPVPLRLTVSDFTHSPKQGQAYRLNATSKISGISEADNAKLAKQQLGPGDSVGILVNAAQIWETGESSAQLRNLGQAVTTIRALHVPQTYNVQIEGSRPEAIFTPKSQPTVTLVNSDPATYRFAWELTAQGFRASGKNNVIELPASGTVQLDLSGVRPPISLFESGTLKNQVLDSTLILHPLIDSNAGIPPLAAKILPLQLRLRYWPGLWQQAAEVFCTFVLLLIGGLASLWFRYFIPNATGALKLRRDLNQMAEKLNGIGDDLESQWRVALSARIWSCREGLSEIPWSFPAFAGQLTQLQNDAKMFQQWLEVAYAMSLVLHETNKLVQNGIPPTVLHLIEERRELALRPILTGFTTDEELQAMKTHLKAAQQYLSALNSESAISDLEDKIEDRETKLQPVLDELRKSFPEFHGLFSQVKDPNGQASPNTYLDRDTISLKCDLLRQYWELATRSGLTLPFPAAVAAAVATGGVASAAQGPPADSLQDRIKGRYAGFKDYLGPDACDSLRVAHLMILEMRQDFYTKSLQTELQKDTAALEIRTDPPEVHPGVPVHFSLRFLRAALNQIAAVQEWACYWNFGDDTAPEAGWDVYHCYAQDSENRQVKPTVSVTLVDLKGNVIQPHVPISTTVTVKPAGPRKGRRWKIPTFTPEAKIEASRLSFVLLLALLGVFATARDKVESLGLLEAAGALIALGFGVDTLKNLITQAPADK